MYQYLRKILPVFIIFIGIQENYSQSFSHKGNSIAISGSHFRLI